MQENTETNKRVIIESNVVLKPNQKQKTKIKTEVKVPIKKKCIQEDEKEEEKVITSMKKGNDTKITQPIEMINTQEDEDIDEQEERENITSK